MQFLKQNLALGVVATLVLFNVVVWGMLLSPYGLNQMPAGLGAFVNTEVTTRSRVAALLAAYPELSSLDPITKNADCTLSGALPDHGCTPGAVFADADTATICVVGYTKGVRSVPLKLRKQIYAVYGVAYPPPTGSYELDHLVPLELGGNNDAANLFPEAAAPTPGFKEKDLVENYLHNEVCAGNVPLAAAQVQIANNWLAVYKSFDSTTIAALRRQFRSWAN